MARHRIIKGLDLPITGEPEQKVSDAPATPRVAVMATDYIGMKPRMAVAEGDIVKRGQLLFEDKKIQGVRFTAPGGGTVIQINRGDKRALQSVVIDLAATEDSVSFESYTGKPVTELSRDDVQALLIESGAWTALRTRPFESTPAPGSVPRAIFVTAMDTNPLAPSPDVVIKGKEAALEAGLAVLRTLTDGPVYLCKSPGSSITTKYEGVSIEEFEGPHPAGTAGLHIHFLSPVCREKTVWHTNYQEVAAIGALFQTGELDVERVIALGGPSVKNPRLLRTRCGASTAALTENELVDGEQRIISGSVLSGRNATDEVHGYLGRFHHQITVLREDREREFLGWMLPGLNKFSVVNLFLSRLFPKKKYDMTTTTNGSVRAIVPIGVYEKVMPMDINPTYLLRAISCGNIERAEELGVLELAEEDLALCTFVCPGKNEYGPLLRDVLTTIEKEG